MRHVSRTHRVALDCLFDRINLDPQIQIKYIDTKNQLADILTKGNFTRDEWNHLLCLFNISHFSSTVCSEIMAKRLQHDSGEERVTAKSRPMMSLIARVPSNVSSSTSVSPVKRSYGHQNPWSTIAEKEERSGRPDIGIDRKKASDQYYHEQLMESFSSASHSKWDDDRAWSSQEWKTDTEMYERSGGPDETSWRATRETRPGFSHEETHHDGTAQSIVNEVIPRDRPGQPVVIPQRGAWPQQFIIGNDEAELELSVESRSFVKRVNDQVRKRQKRISSFTEDGEKHSMIWGMFMTVTMESAVLMGNNHQSTCHSIANETDLTLKQMFDISTRLVSEQDEISGLETIGWENHSWKYLSLIGDERIINLQRAKVCVFSDSVLCLGKIQENPQSNDAWEQRLGWLKSSSKYRNFDRIDGEPTLQLSEEVKRLLLRLDETPENFTGIHKEYGTELLQGCWLNSQKADVQFSALRAHCPEINSKAKDMENCRYTMQPIWKRLRLFFA